MAGLKRTRAQAHVDIETGVSPSGSRWLALYTVAPTATTEGTEVTGGSYARESITFDPADGSAIGESDADVEFAAATADWGNIIAWAVHDASSGTGNQRWWKSITPKSILSGDTARFLAGEVSLKFE